MLTSNGKAVLKINSSYARLGPSVKSTDGTIRSLNAADSGATLLLGALLRTLGLYVGANDTPATSSDYAFTSLRSNLGLTTISMTGTNDATEPLYTQDYMAVFTSTLRNDTASDITVKEVGIIGNAHGQGYDFPVLIARDVFDPITIAPGEIYTFSMYIG